MIHWQKLLEIPIFSCVKIIENKTIFLLFVPIVALLVVIKAGSAYDHRNNRNPVNNWNHVNHQNPVNNWNHGNNRNPGNWNHGNNQKPGQNWNHGNNQNPGQNWNHGNNQNPGQNWNHGNNQNAGNVVNITSFTQIYFYCSMKIINYSSVWKC